MTWRIFVKQQVDELRDLLINGERVGGRTAHAINEHDLIGPPYVFGIGCPAGTKQQNLIITKNECKALKRRRWQRLSQGFRSLVLSRLPASSAASGPRTSLR